MNNTGIIILAAGNSTRLGQPKQLLPYKGATLIAHVVNEALGASLHPIVVVTGAFANEITSGLSGTDIALIHNSRWQEGMGSSIVTGMSALCSLDPNAAAVIIAVCDQPHLSADLLQSLINTQATTEKSIVASTYSDTVGTPVLFTHPYFAALATLSGNEGAKKLLQRYQHDLALVPFPLGHIDIDTPEDYRMLF